ncbi:MAG: low affinity iron permease family protein [Limisphaerales bacterium]
MSNKNGKPKNTFNEIFNKFAHNASAAVGHPLAFFVAILLILGWAVTGPMFHFSDTWQLVINTGTTIITFLMVFLIQNTQNRDARAIHLKVDELLRTGEKARNYLIDVQSMSDEELDELERQFKICRKKRAAVPELPKNGSRGTETAKI